MYNEHHTLPSVEAEEWKRKRYLCTRVRLVKKQKDICVRVYDEQQTLPSAEAEEWKSKKIFLYECFYNEQHMLPSVSPIRPPSGSTITYFTQPPNPLFTMPKTHMLLKEQNSVQNIWTPHHDLPFNIVYRLHSEETVHFPSFQAAQCTLVQSTNTNKVTHRIDSRC